MVPSISDVGSDGKVRMYHCKYCNLDLVEFGFQRHIKTTKHKTNKKEYQQKLNKR